MYINSTNLALNLPEYNTKGSFEWIASEKYYNCDNFYYHMNMGHRRRNLFGKNRLNKNENDKIS
jgi:hypothetical protein